ncbi:MAG: TetR family transcriptional regulator, partial [Solirubrobacterales bacterium]
TSVADIAAAVGVERRTIFRYFPSKNDIVWGNFDWVIERLRSHLEESDGAVPLLAALRHAAVRSNHYPDEELPALRVRMTLITTAPALQAHSMLRYAAWRRAIAEWAAGRRGERPDDLAPELIAQAALAASMAAFSRWVRHPEEDLGRCLEQSYGLLGAGFGELAGER